MNTIEKEKLSSAVYDIVRIVPRGRATSYGAIAKAVGYPNMSRLVGKIMSQCDSKVTKIPAHRVVNSQGILSGASAFGNEDEMKELLESEGILVTNNKIRNWKSIFWNPIDEIQI